MTGRREDIDIAEMVLEVITDIIQLEMDQMSLYRLLLELMRTPQV